MYCRFVGFAYTEVEDALKEVDDGVYFVREMKENAGKEYEICIRYIRDHEDLFRGIVQKL